MGFRKDQRVRTDYLDSHAPGGRRRSCEGTVTAYRPPLVIVRLDDPIEPKDGKVIFSVVRHERDVVPCGGQRWLRKGASERY